MTLMRKCGYGQIVSSRNGEQSYARRLSVGLYPRFHVFIKSLEQGFVLNLHLDQKKASYTGHTAHSGEYDGVVVKHEGERIKQIISNFKF
jgi:hypothetical protein